LSENGYETALLTSHIALLFSFKTEQKFSGQQETLTMRCTNTIATLRYSSVLAEGRAVPI